MSCISFYWIDAGTVDQKRWRVWPHFQLPMTLRTLPGGILQLPEESSLRSKLTLTFRKRSSLCNFFFFVFGNIFQSVFSIKTLKNRLFIFKQFCQSSQNDLFFNLFGNPFIFLHDSCFRSEVILMIRIFLFPSQFLFLQVSQTQLMITFLQKKSLSAIVCFTGQITIY